MRSDTAGSGATISLDALSALRRQAWLEAVAPDEPYKLERRLAWDGLDSAELECRWSVQSRAAGAAAALPAMPPDSAADPSAGSRADAALAELLNQLLSESPDRPASASPWWGALQDSRRAMQASWEEPLLPYDPGSTRCFVDLWWPVRALAVQRLQRLVAELPGNWIAPEPVAGQFADSLLDRLCGLTDQVLWQRFSAGRTPGVMLLAHLGAEGDGKGPPVREHYEAFIRRHRRDGLASLLREFPVLARLIGTVLTLWQEGSEELLRRVRADQPLLASRFAVPAGHRLSGVSQGLSDPHRGGRVVAILHFCAADRAEDAVRIVYKPKDMGVDAAFQAALHDLNSHSTLPPLRTLAVHAAAGYGYMEYVPHRICADSAELEHFYANAGRLTAVLHVLGCTDCHHENLIACGDQLLLIDTETLLEPELPDHVSEAAAQSQPASPSRLQQRLSSSVLRSGLLPQWLVVGAARRVVDVSALGVRSPELPHRSEPGWLGINSDGMMPGRISRAVDHPTSLPVGIGTANPFQPHLRVFCEGFERQCLALQEIRSRWLAEGGAISRFRGLPRRIVLRDTRIYLTLQRQLLAAEALRSPFAQAMVLEQLARSYLLAETLPLHWPVFAAERRQMARLDIPFFTHRIDGDALLLSEGPQPDPDSEPALAGPWQPELPGFIRTSGMVGAYGRHAALDTAEIAFQVRLIRGAAAARILGSAPIGSSTAATEAGATAPDEPVLPPSRFDPLQAACRVGRQLLEIAIVDPGGEMEWLGMDLGGDGETFRFGPLGSGLYGGSIGIACLMRRLHALGEVAFSPIAAPDAVVEAILRPLRELASEPQPDRRLRWWRDQPLGLSGCGGMLLALQCLGEADAEESLLQAALPRVLRNDRKLDLMGGCTGLIGPLLLRGDGMAIALARIAATHLLEQQNENGGWCPRPGEPPLLGFSHGTAGYAAALARMHQISGEERFLQAAAAALAYERQYFDCERGNWPDFRRMSPSTPMTGAAERTPGFMTSWCHGAPGIAMGRACLWGTPLWDDHCLEEMEAALRTTAAYPEVEADHLCCGNLGQMAVLELVGEGPWPLAESVRDLCREAARGHRNRALVRCSPADDHGVALRCFSMDEGSLILPDLFTGISGMALALLEDPESRRMLAMLLTSGLWPEFGEEARTAQGDPERNRNLTT